MEKIAYVYANHNDQIADAAKSIPGILKTDRADTDSALAKTLNALEQKEAAGSIAVVHVGTEWDEQFGTNIPSIAAAKGMPVVIVAREADRALAESVKESIPNAGLYVLKADNSVDRTEFLSVVQEVEQAKLGKDLTIGFAAKERQGATHPDNVRGGDDVGISVLGR